MKKQIIRARVGVLSELQGNKKDVEFAKDLGVSPATIYRSKLSPEDPRYAAPSSNFIAAVLLKFPNRKFEQIFSPKEEVI